MNITHIYRVKSRKSMLAAAGWLTVSVSTSIRTNPPAGEVSHAMRRIIDCTTFSIDRVRTIRRLTNSFNSKSKRKHSSEIHCANFACEEELGMESCSTIRTSAQLNGRQIHLDNVKLIIYKLRTFEYLTDL